MSGNQRPKRATSGEGDDANKGLDSIYRTPGAPRTMPPAQHDDDDATPVRPKYSAVAASSDTSAAASEAPDRERHLMNRRGRFVFITAAIVAIVALTSYVSARTGSSLVWFIGAPLMVVATLVGVLGRTAAFTVASTLLPGLGLLGAKSRFARVLGVVFPALVLAAIAWAGFSASADLGNFASIAVNPSQLRTVTVAAIAAGLVWVSLIAGTHLLTRPRGWSVGRRALGSLLVAALSFSVAGSAALAARYSFDQNKLVTTVFASEDEVTSTSRPSIDGAEKDPWRNTPRVNIMLLGADGADARDDANGIRTDTIMVASIDTVTGETTIVQIPRNVQYTPFPEGSDMNERFPRGFRGEGDPAEHYINALWNSSEMYNPQWFEGDTYPGAEAMKLGVEGITGLKIDYFVLLNIDGVQRLIDAMGGVDVNINRRLPVGGNTDGKRPTSYLEQGPDQHLGGYEAMWYARSRSDSSDYERMGRQSCLVDAIIKQANPATMLSSYEAIASASADMVLTDIPQQVLEPMVSLSLKVKDSSISRLVFSPGKNGYSFEDPDFDEMRQSVQTAIGNSPSATDVTPKATNSPVPSTPAAPSPTPDPSASASADPVLVEGAQAVADACAYNPDEPTDGDFENDGFGDDDEG